MAHRFFQQFSFGLEKAVVRLPIVVTATASQTGNAAQTLTRAKGVASVTAAATGQWTINLGVPSGPVDSYNALIGVHMTVQPATPATAGNIAGCQVLVATNVGSNTAPKVVLQMLGGVNGVAATAPSTGDIFYIELVLSNSGAF